MNGSPRSLSVRPGACPITRIGASTRPRYMVRGSTGNPTSGQSRHVSIAASAAAKALFRASASRGEEPISSMEMMSKFSALSSISLAASGFSILDLGHRPY